MTRLPMLTNVPPNMPRIVHRTCHIFLQLFNYGLMARNFLQCIITG